MQYVTMLFTFESTETKETFNIYYKVSCKSYLSECLLSKIQYVRKSESPFHIRLKNRRKDVKNPHTIEAFRYSNNYFNLF